MGIPPRTFGTLEVKRRESLVTRAVVMPIQQFIHIQGISSIFLLAAAVGALAWANSPWQESYHHIWEMELTLSKLRLPLHAWINDALMAIFFLLVGMEIKHEILHGELADMRRAALPVVAALGGMIVPVVPYLILNHRHDSQQGWGIPMATDIAFSMGVLGTVKGIRSELKIFLLTLAIADDICAIAVIALFYTNSLNGGALFAGLLLLGLLAILQRLGISHPVLYFVLALGFWVAILRSGIHATIAGVILGFVVPTTPTFSLQEFQEIGSRMVVRFRKAVSEGDEKTAKNLLGSFEVLAQSTESVSERLTRHLNDWVSFLVLPLFALANAGVTFSGEIVRGLLTSRVAWGVFLGLVCGKPLGIFCFSKLAVRWRFAQLPIGVSWQHIRAIAVLAGIGFTVSIFISSLAFETDPYLSGAKTAVLVASSISGMLGYLMLKSHRDEKL
jgi:NhaA family Na+:H+ antiporter